MAQAPNTAPMPYMGRQGPQHGGQNMYMYPSPAARSYPGYNAPPDHNQYYPAYLPQNDLSQVYPTPAAAPPAYRAPGWDQRQQYPMSRHDMPAQYRHESPPAQEPSPFLQIYSFVPIHGAQHQKRPRRKYEEVERIYKCDWNGCEKAYGTLNHLNAHVTMQNHGQKRSPEAFKEIRKEWKAKKKAEEAKKKEKHAKKQAGDDEERRDSGVSALSTADDTPTASAPSVPSAHATDHYPLPEPRGSA